MRGMPEGADSGCHPDWVESGKKLPSELGLGPCEALAALPALDMALSAMRGSAGSLNPDWGAALDTRVELMRCCRHPVQVMIYRGLGVSRLGR